MAKKEEMGVGDLLKLMIEMNNKDREDREKSKQRMAEEARIREEEREERALVKEQKRIDEARIREAEMKAQAEEREHKMVVALKETRPILESVKLPTMERGTDIESFLELFETALTVAKVPQGKASGSPGYMLRLTAKPNCLYEKCL